MQLSFISFYLWTPANVSAIGCSHHQSWTMTNNDNNIKSVLSEYMYLMHQSIVNLFFNSPGICQYLYTFFFRIHKSTDKTIFTRNIHKIYTYYILWPFGEHPVYSFVYILCIFLVYSFIWWLVYPENFFIYNKFWQIPGE